MKIFGTELVFDVVKLIDILGTLVAAFGGAWFAFLFERRNKEKEEASRQIAAAGRAVYTIFNLWNIQKQFAKEHIDDYRERPDAWLNMPGNFPSSYGLTKFEAGELSFLLGQDSMVFGELMLEEQRFDLAMTLVAERSRIVRDEVFPRLTAAGIGINQQAALATIEAALGAGVVRKLKVLTAGIIENVDENLGSLKAVHDRLFATMKKLYPKQKFPKVDFDALPTTQADTPAGG